MIPDWRFEGCHHSPAHFACFFLLLLQFMQKVGQIAAERSVVLTSALQRRSSEAKTAAHTIVHSGEEKLLSRFRKRASIRSVGLMAATGVHHHNKRN